jgi:hypothetical protein
MRFPAVGIGGARTPLPDIRRTASMASPNRGAVSVQRGARDGLPGLLRDTGELPEVACRGEALAHLQALQAFLVAGRATARFKLRPSFRVEREQTGVEASRVCRGDVVDQDAEPGALQCRTVTLRSLEPRKPPQLTKVLVRLGRDWLTHDMIIERQRPLYVDSAPEPGALCQSCRVPGTPEWETGHAPRSSHASVSPLASAGGLPRRAAVPMPCSP